MKPILITILLSLLFLFILKFNVGGTQKVDDTTAKYQTKTVKIKCAIPVNGVINGNLPPCNIFPEYNKNNHNKKAFDEPYVINNSSHNNFINFEKRALKSQREADATYKKYKDEFQESYDNRLQTQNQRLYSKARDRAEKKEAIIAAKLSKEQQIKSDSKKGLTAKSRVVKCTNSSGNVFYSNHCSNNKTQKELQIVKFPKTDYRRRSTYKGYDDKASSKISSKNPKTNKYSNLSNGKKGNQE